MTSSISFFCIRYMLGLAGVPAVIMGIGFLFMPESPRWLVRKGKLIQAKRVLIKIRGTACVDKELASIERNHQKESQDERKGGGGGETWGGEEEIVSLLTHT